MSDKRVMNALASWTTYAQYGDLRIVGRATIDQPTAGVKRGDFLLTSPIVRIYLVSDEFGDQRFLETKNSLYILIDD